MSNYEERREWADKYKPAIGRILKQHAGLLVSIEVAPDQQDKKQATDYIIEIIGGCVAARVRKAEYLPRFRDLTIRSWLRSGYQTELQKIKAGFADWYPYAWHEIKVGDFVDWMLVDLDKLRGSGLLDKQRKTIMNADGRSGFIAISDTELGQCGCIVAEGGGDTLKKTVPAKQLVFALPATT